MSFRGVGCISVECGRQYINHVSFNIIHIVVDSHLHQEVSVLLVPDVLMSKVVLCIGKLPDGIFEAGVLKVVKQPFGLLFEIPICMRGKGEDG